jgi:hypothetical protein
VLWADVMGGRWVEICRHHVQRQRCHTLQKGTLV